MKKIDSDEVATYLITDVVCGVCGVIHAALDAGIAMETIQGKIEMAINHVTTERKMMERGICTKCEREFGGPYKQERK